MDQLDDAPVPFVQKDQGDDRKNQVEGNAEKLREAVLASATEARRAFFMFGAFTLYLVITVGTTTHEHLLRGTTFQLPILNVNIPLVGFYLVVPALFFLAHLNLLGELNALAENAEKLKRIIGKHQSKVSLPFPFGISRAFIQPSEARAPRRIIVFVVIMSAIVIPPFVLLAVQVRLLAYHSEAVTWLHRGLVAADILALWLLWPKSREAIGKGRWYADPWSWLKSIRWYRAMAVPATISMMIISCLFVTVPEEWIERNFVELSQHLSPIKQSVAAEETAIQSGGKCTLAPWHVFSVVYVASQHRSHYDSSRGDRAVPCWTYLLFEGSDSVVSLRRNLIVSNTDLVVIRPMPELVRDKLGKELRAVWEDVGSGLDLRGRDLRFADLASSDLRKADFRGADLTGARLLHARLDYAQFGDIRIADLGDCASGFEDVETLTCKTSLRKANLQGANLSFTGFYKANLEGANLIWAIMLRSDMDHANLDDASWYRAQIDETTKIPKEFRCDAKRGGADYAHFQCIWGYGYSLPPPLLSKKSSACPKDPWAAFTMPKRCSDQEPQQQRNADHRDAGRDQDRAGGF